MEFEEFEICLATARVESESRGVPEGFHLFDARTASDSEILQVEQELRVQLPGKYKEFMGKCGGGQFLFLDILPVISPGEDDLLSVNESEFRAKGFVAISPVGTGDWWGFSVVDGVCRDQVDFIDHEDGQLHFSALDVLEFLVREGL